MTLADLLNAQAIAGSAYAAAVEQLHAAYVNLAGIEQALQNAGIGHDAAPDVRTFAHLSQNCGAFEHPKFAVIDPAVDWRDEALERRIELLKKIWY